MSCAQAHIVYRGPRHNRRGFAVAAVLYLLGLIGVIGGVLYSGNMQTIRSVLTVQNSLSVRSDMLAASSTLSAEAVLSADNQTLCPPRSVHQTSGDPCATAPVALTQLGDIGTDPHLPANAATASASGAPVEVGVFTVGAGLKQLDPSGHYYIYCRWENSRSTPAAPALVILSAGPDGNLQTKCGDSVAQGDDSLTMLTVGEAINRAAIWQSDASNNVSYGSTGSKVTIDSGGDLNAAGNITAAGSLNAASAAITNGITAATVTTTGDISAKNFLGTGTVSGSLGSFVTLDASTAAITNGITASTLAASGDITGKDLSASGTVSGTTGSFVTLDASNAAITNGLTAASLTASGPIAGQTGIFSAGLTAADLTASGTVTGSTGTFTNLNASNATLGATAVASLTDSGNATIGGTLAVTGATTGSSATYTGIVTAAGFSGSMTLGGSGVTISGVIPITNGGTGASSALASLNNLGVTNGGVFNTGLLTAGLINGSYLTSNSVTSTQLNATGVASGLCYSPTVSTDGRITACGSTAPASAAGSTGDIQFDNGSSLAASNSLYWDNTNDRLGIGTTAPDAQLEIYGTLPSINLASTQNAKKEYQFVNDGNYAYIKDVTDALGEFRIRSNANADVARFSYAAPSNSLVLTSSGYVGIGSSSPAYSLDVYAYNTSPLRAYTSYGNPAATFSTGNGTAIDAVGGGNVAIALYATVASGSTPRATILVGQPTGMTADLTQWESSGGTTLSAIKYNGAFSVGTQSSANMLDVAGGVAIGSGGYAGTIAAPANGAIIQGNVGIGTTSPNSTLTVNGTETVSGAASLNSSLNVNGAAIFNNLVGIGTSNPQSPLDIYASSGSYAYIRDAQSGFKIVSGGGGNYIESAGSGMSGAAPLSIMDMNGAHTWLSFAATGIAEFWDSVGIGTATPQSSLDIYGNAAIGKAYAGATAAPSNGLIVQGSVGIGSTTPVTTLDINGYMRLAKNSSAPATCSATDDGSLALTAIHTLCVCNGSAWATVSDGATACTWTNSSSPVQIVLSTAGAGTWTVPANWNSSNNRIEVVGAGAGGASFNFTSAGSVGGGGGAYSNLTNLALTPGATINYNIGTGGAGETASAAAQTGSDTWFNATTFASASVAAKGGNAVSNGNTGGTGGAATSGIGTTKNSGGNGGNSGTNNAGAGGGGAAGPNGNGVIGVAGASGSSSSGGAGGNGDNGSGGAGGTGGTSSSKNGSTGTSGTISGGGGGGGYASSGNGGAGGVAGAGGGGGGSGGNSTLGGQGTNGQIIITYTP